MTSSGSLFSGDKRWRNRLSFQAIYIYLALVTYSCLASALPTRGLFTKSTTPNEGTGPGSSDEACLPATWCEILLFYLGNYVTHATTVKPRPGEPRWNLFLRTYLALLYPQSTLKGGIKNILRGILEHTATSGNLPLELAAKADALCMVVRASDWMPQEGDEFKNGIFVSTADDSTKHGHEGFSRLLPHVQKALWKMKRDKPIDLVTSFAPSKYTLPNSYKTYSELKTLVPNGHRIHGTCKLPSGYKLAVVPANASISHSEPKALDIPSSFSNTQNNSDTIATSYGFAKAVVSFIQALFSSLNIYMSKGDQISQYGYAAFGLTIIPFTVMSVVNLVSNLRLPEHSALYLVESDIMDEATRHGGSFRGVVGKLCNEDALTDTAHGISGKFTQNEDGSGLMVHLKLPLHGVPSTVLPQPKKAYENHTTEFQIELQNKFSHYLGDAGSDISLREMLDADASGRCQAVEIQHVAHARKERSKLRGESALIVPSFHSFKLETKKTHNGIAASNITGRSLAELAHSPWVDALDSLFWSFLVTGVSIIVTGSLTHFNKGHSTRAQRIWLILWQWVGAWFSPIVAQGQSVLGLWRDSQREKSRKDSEGRYSFEWKLFLLQFAIVVVYSVPAIGGFMVVGQMLRQYGGCASLE